MIIHFACKNLVHECITGPKCYLRLRSSALQQNVYHSCELARAWEHQLYYTGTNNIYCHWNRVQNIGMWNVTSFFCCVTTNSRPRGQKYYLNFILHGVRQNSVGWSNLAQWTAWHEQHCNQVKKSCKKPGSPPPGSIRDWYFPKLFFVGGGCWTASVRRIVAQPYSSIPLLRSHDFCVRII